jgi:hypothetical protein
MFLTNVARAADHVVGPPRKTMGALAWPFRNKGTGNLRHASRACSCIADGDGITVGTSRGTWLPIGASEPTSFRCAEAGWQLVARVPSALGDGAKSAAGQGCGRRGWLEGRHHPHQLFQPDEDTLRLVQPLLLLTAPIPRPTLEPLTNRSRHTRRKPGSQSHGSSPPPRRRSLGRHEGPQDRRAASGQLGGCAFCRPGPSTVRHADETSLAPSRFQGERRPVSVRSTKPQANLLQGAHP